MTKPSHVQRRRSGIDAHPRGKTHMSDFKLEAYDAKR
jgi:hypothetical protein